MTKLHLHFTVDFLCYCEENTVYLIIIDSICEETFSHGSFDSIHSQVYMFSDEQLFTERQKPAIEIWLEYMCTVQLCWTDSDVMSYGFQQGTFSWYFWALHQLVLFWIYLYVWKNSLFWGSAKLNLFWGSAKLNLFWGSAKLNLFWGNAKLDPWGCANLNLFLGSVKLNLLWGSAKLNLLWGSAKLNLFWGSAGFNLFQGSAKLNLI